MIDDKKKQRQTLAAVVVIMVLVMGYTYWTNFAPARKAASPVDKVAKAQSLPSAGNAQIRLDLLNEKMDKNAVGRRNVFQYYVPPPPPKQPPPPPQVVVSQPPRPPAPVVPTTPAQPPSALSTFKYDAIVTSADPGKLMASISDGPTNRYNVSVGEYILGRYRINRVTETQVEIEDLDQPGRRQTYSRQTQ